MNAIKEMGRFAIYAKTIKIRLNITIAVNVILTIVFLNQKKMEMINNDYR